MILTLSAGTHLDLELYFPPGDTDQWHKALWAGKAKLPILLQTHRHGWGLAPELEVVLGKCVLSGWWQSPSVGWRPPATTSTSSSCYAQRDWEEGGLSKSMWEGWDGDRDWDGMRIEIGMRWG